MHTKYTKEEIENSEEIRLQIINESLDDSSNLLGKIKNEYSGPIQNFQKERRDMLKFLATISGGAAALSPQLIDYVKQDNFFYWAIFFLCLVVIISATNIIATVENESSNLDSSLKKNMDLVFSVRNPKLKFLQEGDHSVGKFKEAFKPDVDHFSSSDFVRKEHKDTWYKPMDYTSEFVILFMVSGLGLLVLSLTNHYVGGLNILYLMLAVFVLINIISTFPDQVFKIFGAPIDLIKAIVRSIFKKLSKKE